MTLDDLRETLATISRNPNEVAHIGHVTRGSVGVIQRALLRLGETTIFGPDALDVADWQSGLHLLDASALYHQPRMYGALLLYILRDLARRAPETGDLDRPRLALVFDEAHTIFHEASPALLRSVEATARLIRSKGIMLIWATQSPQDIPEIIRAQCATKIEHYNAIGVGHAYFTTINHATTIISPTMPTYALDPVPYPASRMARPATPATPATPAWVDNLWLAFFGFPFMIWLLFN